MRQPYLTVVFCLIIAGCCIFRMGYAQTCIIINVDTIICQGSTVAFTLQTTGGTATAYAWNFGNGFTANTAAPAHTYTSSGDFTPTVTVTFAAGGTCTATGSPIKVRATPIAGFAITTSREMCFKGNELCVEDKSVPGASLAPIKQRAYQLSNGYIQIDTPPYASQICYRNNVDFGGHLYTLVLEVTDTNNCVGKSQKKDSVLLYPKFERLSYLIDSTIYCNKTRIQITNTSLMPVARVKSFRWVLGDGDEDQTNWLVTHHDYTVDGHFRPLLIVKDTQDCVDTLYGEIIPIDVFEPDSAIYPLKPTTQCYNGNGYSFVSVNEKATFQWRLFNPRGVLEQDSLFPSNDLFSFHATTCGIYRVNLTVKRGQCTFTTDSFVTVLGPKAIIEDDFNRVVNSHQCIIKDTVYFKTPVPFLSCINNEGYNLNYLWNFDDPFAPLCTLDTRRAINLGMNCNFSVDSMVVRHFYTPGKEACYKPWLNIEDTVLGCSHTDHIKMPLMRPIAISDSTAMPPREGLKLAYPGVKCLNQPVAFLLNTCEYSVTKIWTDSLCDTCGWYSFDSLFVHSYERTVDTSGYVTVGLIIGNGESDSTMCYDTAWYHHFLQLMEIKPAFTIDIEPDCGPYSVHFIPEDTIQQSIWRVYWRITSPIDLQFVQTFTQVLAPDDSIVKPYHHIFDKPGVYQALARMDNLTGCTREFLGQFALGNVRSFGSVKPMDCVDDTIDLFSNIFYYDYHIVGGINYLVPYWQFPDRAAAGKETVWWDIGDSNGVSLTGGNVHAKYTKAGRYTVKMISQDSIGCKDTLVKNQFVTITDINAYIAQLQNEYYCAPQIISFKDSSIVFDTLPVTTHSLVDSVLFWKWDFGDQTVEGSLEDVAHNYTRNGVFDVRLIATTVTGCSDTAFSQLNITGPTPSFVIQDTMGCVPFNAVFENTTGKLLKSWTWYFGDSANQTLTTLNDSNVLFTYNKPGVYAIRLLGTQNVTNPTTGNTTNCNSFFPDPLTQLPVRKVYVLPIAPVNFEMKDSICLGEEVLFTAHSDQSYTKFSWRISNGTNMLLVAPDSVTRYTFDLAGHYKVWLVPLENPSTECWDSASKEISVLHVKADFDMDSTGSPHYFFRNQSVGAINYRWNFGKPLAGAANESDREHADFDYGKDTATYEVCLYAFDQLGCSDSVCKPLSIRQTRLVIPNVFTPDNDDGYNDAFDIDILGFTDYHLIIYNRWGTLVYEGFSDGVQNDGINWNGHDHQTGPPCAEGVYYYLFTYKFFNEQELNHVHGTITLLRDK
jgi:gliding motility-associated-like protein